MAIHRNLKAAAILAVAALAQLHIAHADVVVPLDPSGWVFHNQAVAGGTVSGTLNSPTFKQADNVVAVMAPFAYPVPLLNNGDFVEVSLTLQMSTRAGDSLGANALNTGLRIGLFNGPAGPIVPGDTGNLGILAQYQNNLGTPAMGGPVNEQTNPAGTNPFQNPTLALIGNGGADAGGDSIRGANVGNVLFDLKLTRNNGKFDITGQISGTDSVSLNPYSSAINLLGYTPTAAAFAFNRVGFFFGNRADGDAPTTNSNFTATLSNVTITTNVAAVPESQFGMLAVALAIGGVTIGVRVHRASPRRGQAPG
jgi:hypothetical protein